MSRTSEKELYKFIETRGIETGDFRDLFLEAIHDMLDETLAHYSINECISVLKREGWSNTELVQALTKTVKERKQTQK